MADLWTAEMNQKFREAHARGLTMRELGAMFGVSRSAAAAKANRLGLVRNKAKQMPGDETESKAVHVPLVIEGALFRKLKSHYADPADQLVSEAIESLLTELVHDDEIAHAQPAEGGA